MEVTTVIPSLEPVTSQLLKSKSQVTLASIVHVGTRLGQDFTPGSTIPQYKEKNCRLIFEIRDDLKETLSRQHMAAAVFQQ